MIFSYFITLVLCLAYVDSLVIINQNDFSFDGEYSFLNIEGDKNQLLNTINLNNNTSIKSETKSTIKVTKNAFFLIEKSISLIISNIEFFMEGPGVLENGLIRSSDLAKNFSIKLEVNYKKSSKDIKSY